MGRVTFSGGKPGMEKPVSLSTTLNDNTWEQIRKASDAGIAFNLWSVGDTKTITISGKAGNNNINYTLDVFILGFNHNSSVEGNNTIHFQIGKNNGVDIALFDSYYDKTPANYYQYCMVGASTSRKGWSGCSMRSYILGSGSSPTNPSSNTLLSALPSDLREVMKRITKYTDNTGDGSDTASYVTATTDSLWLLAEFEVFGVRTKANSAEKNKQKQYDYYKVGNSKIKKRSTTETSIGAAAQWHLRSIATNGTGSTSAFCTVSTTGTAATCSWQWGAAVAPAFAV